MISESIHLRRCCCVVIGAACVLAGSSWRGWSAERVPADLAGTFEQKIPRLMREQNIPGLSVVIVDEQGTAWCRGFGQADDGGARDVAPDTIFSIQSASKTFTAVAVMIAAQEGRVNLDEPITRYLPGFRVNSVFEARPEEKITLRHLLSHTAGFPHEAPAGNNYDLANVPFDTHVRSISATWLRFPVGENYAYSNLGIDLAGFIVQTVAGMPVERFFRERLFEPLGMTHSRLGDDDLERDPNHAVGHAPYYSHVPARVPMLCSGGVYTSARDIGEFIRFMLNDGRIGERQILKPGTIESLCAVPPFVGGRTDGYGMGIVRFPRKGPACYGHSGGGFGFLSDMYWYPRVGLGAAVLTNSSGHSLQQDLIFQILDALLADSRTIYHERLKSLSPNEAQAPFASSDPGADLAASNEKRFASLASTAVSAPLSDDTGYAGDYVYSVWGKAGGMIRLRSRKGVLTLDGERLRELRPGLFFTASGNALDLRGPTFTWRNIRIARFQIPMWQKALFVVSMLLFPLGMPIGSYLAFRERRRSAQAPGGARPGGSKRLVVARIPLLLAASAWLLLIGGLLQRPYFINSGMLDPTPDIPLVHRLFMVSPAVFALLTAVMAAIAAGLWWSPSCPPSFKRRFAVVTSGSVLFTGLLFLWKLVSI